MLSTFVILALLGSALAYKMESMPAVKDKSSDDKCPSLQECSLNCVFGYAVNDEGCRVCECSNKPCRGFSCAFATKFTSMEKDCSETGTCGVIPKQGVCPDITCQTFCEYGFEVGKLGCPICRCKAHPCMKPENQCDSNHTCIANEGKCENPPCDWTSKCAPKCDEMANDVYCEFGFKRDENDCETYQCKEDFCDGVTCSVNQECVHDPHRRDASACVCKKPTCNHSCPFGLARDKTGCEICKCAADPCESVDCKHGYKCVPVQEPVCLEKPCPYKPKCFLHFMDVEDVIID